MEKAAQHLDQVTDRPPEPTAPAELLGLFDDPNQDIDWIIDLLGLFSHR